MSFYFINSRLIFFHMIFNNKFVVIQYLCNIVIYY